MLRGGALGRKKQDVERRYPGRPAERECIQRDGAIGETGGARPMSLSAASPPGLFIFQ